MSNKNLLRAMDDDEEPRAGVPPATRSYGINIPRAPRPSVPENAIVQTSDGSFQYKRIVITAIGLELPDDLTFDEWVDLGTVLTELESSVQWAVGDWGAHAAIHLDELLQASGAYPTDIAGPDFESKYALLMARTGYSYQTVRDYAWVASSVPVSIRNRQLSFSHHRLVAPMRDENGQPLLDLQQEWLQAAHEHGWTIAQMRKAIADANKHPTPTLSAPHVVLFEKTNRPSTLSKLQKTADRAIGQGDEKAKQVLLSQIDHWRNWLAELENLARLR